MHIIFQLLIVHKVHLVIFLSDILSKATITLACFWSNWRILITEWLTDWHVLSSCGMCCGIFPCRDVLHVAYTSRLSLMQVLLASFRQTTYHPHNESHHEFPSMAGVGHPTSTYRFICCRFLSARDASLSTCSFCVVVGNYFDTECTLIFIFGFGDESLVENARDNVYARYILNPWTYLIANLYLSNFSNINCRRGEALCRGYLVNLGVYVSSFQSLDITSSR